MYRSPIDIIYSDLNMKLENEVYKAIQNVCISVDKEELIKALAYDRQQYEQGYADAKAEEQLTLANPEPKLIFDKLQPQFNLYYLSPDQPRQKRGRWEVHDILDYAQRPTGRKVGKCPLCGFLTDEFRTRVSYYRQLTHFCPNCGAEMQAEPYKGEA